MSKDQPEMKKARTVHQRVIGLENEAAKAAFSKRLNDAFVRSGFTNQSDLARAAGLERNRISAYMNGKALPTQMYLVKLAAALKMKPYELLPDDRLHEGPTPVKVVFSRDHSRVRITVDTWLPTAIGTDVIKLIGEHAIAHGE